MLKVFLKFLSISPYLFLHFRPLYLKVGGFRDLLFFPDFHDVDLCHRIRTYHLTEKGEKKEKGEVEEEKIEEIGGAVKEKKEIGDDEKDDKIDVVEKKEEGYLKKEENLLEKGEAESATAIGEAQKEATRGGEVTEHERELESDGGERAAEDAERVEGVAKNTKSGEREEGERVEYGVLFSPSVTSSVTVMGGIVTSLLSVLSVD